MKKNNLLIVTGTRAEYGLIKSTIFKLKKSKLVNVKLLATGMHTLKKYGYTINEIKKDFPVDCVVPVRETDDMLTALSKEIEGISRYVKKAGISAILVIGDRDEPFAAATVGIHQNIPVIHVSGGDQSGPTVDRYLRDAITVFSQLHLVQTPKSKNNVIALGANPKNVWIVGSAGLDQLSTRKLLSRSDLAKQLKLKTEKDWFLVAQHPTPFASISFKQQISGVITAIKKLDGEKIIVYPNADTGSKIFIKSIEALKGKKNYRLYQNLSHETFLSLLNQSAVFIGNSSAGLMEAGYLKKPFVLAGNRQKNREAGTNVIPATYQPPAITKAINLALSQKFLQKMKKSPSIYQGGDVSGRITKQIEKFLKQYE